MTTDRGAAEELEGVLPLAELVQYQAGAVVSRTLLKKEAGTVTAFAFDVGEGLSEHTAPFDALVMIIEGESEISVAGTSHRVSAGHLLRLPAGQPHALKAITPFKMLLIMIRAPGAVA
jgi:quercetin dioxygenase-like cupin family protein